MCKCTPETRTPFCGKPGCEWPVRETFNPEQTLTPNPIVHHAKWSGELLDMPLPCDITIGVVTFNKGTLLRTLIDNSKRWYDSLPTRPAPQKATFDGPTFNCPLGVRERLRSRDAVSYWMQHGDQQTCWYCGSLSPDTFFAMLDAGAELLPTDKNYKVYIKMPKVGQCKFYFEHLSEEEKKRFIIMLNDKKIKIGYPGHFYRVPFFIKMAKPSDAG